MMKDVLEMCCCKSLQNKKNISKYNFVNNVESKFVDTKIY